jgi:hypothetical protein
MQRAFGSIFSKFTPEGFVDLEAAITGRAVVAGQTNSHVYPWTVHSLHDSGVVDS